MNTAPRWSARQRRMLLEMGIRLWDDARADVDAVQAQAPQTPARATSAAGAGAAPAAVVSTLPPPPPPPRPASAAPAPPAPRPTVPTAVTQVAAAPAPAAGLGPRPDGIERMQWPDLQQAVATCRACSLCQSRRNTVFGVGNPAAHWMLVGEAPGEQEDAQGEPFVGKAGQLLDRMLEAVGLTRADAAPERQVFIANVLKCRPPGNRNPLPQEVAQCEPFLLRQIELVRPRLVLAMGRFAVQSLLRSDEPIGRLRGRVHQYHGVSLVVTYHPAYLLRNPTDKARSWEDLCLAREVLAGLPPR